MGLRKRVGCSFRTRYAKLSKNASTCTGILGLLFPSPWRLNMLAASIYKPYTHIVRSIYLIGVFMQGVCRLHGICIDSLPNLYLITEPVCGGTLEAYLQTTQSKGVPMERAVPLARSIAGAMKDVHAKGMVHRDLKPSNCVLTT